MRFLLRRQTPVYRQSRVEYSAERKKEKLVHEEMLGIQ
jgi:hypothetical protein